MATIEDVMYSSDEEEEEVKDPETANKSKSKTTSKKTLKRKRSADDDDVDEDDNDDEEEEEAEEDDDENGEDDEEDEDEEDEDEEDEDEEDEDEEDEDEEVGEDNSFKKAGEGAEISALSVTQPEAIPEMTDQNLTFAKLNVPSWLIECLEALKITRPTPVQAACIPRIMDGSDVLGCAKTGTGKTLAFAIPILKKLAIDPYGVFALILTPTRELAIQISEQFKSIGGPISLKQSVIIGGKDIITQANQLRQKPHIVVATPGRLADLIDNNESFTHLFKKIQFFVIDEADIMLDGQYNDDLKTIFDAIPKERQTLLFSATLSQSITTLHSLSTRKPYFFEDKTKVSTVANLEQKYVLCPQHVKDAYLVYVVKNYTVQNPRSSVLVFSQSCQEAHALSYMFAGLGFEVAVLHSQVAQKIRLASLASFRNKTKRVLICTDVAARGLDIPHVDLVINHNIPRCPKTYVHRVGRSARAGRFGSALNFVTQFDINLMKACEAYVGKQFDELKINHKEVVKYTTKVLVARKEAELKLESENFVEKGETKKRIQLIQSGMTEEEADDFIENRKKERAEQLAKKISTLQKRTQKPEKKTQASEKRPQNPKRSK